jgi:hypothetical protein
LRLPHAQHGSFFTSASHASSRTRLERRGVARLLFSRVRRIMLPS